MTKRTFLKTSGLGTAALLTDPLAALGGGALPGRFAAEPEVNWLVPLFWSDDLLRLAHLSELPAPQLQALSANLELVHLGRAWEVSSVDVLTLLDESRALLEADDELERDRALTQYALCSGHVAAGILTEKCRVSKQLSRRSRPTPTSCAASRPPRVPTGVPPIPGQRSRASRRRR